MLQVTSICPSANLVLVSLSSNRPPSWPCSPAPGLSTVKICERVLQKQVEPSFHHQSPWTTQSSGRAAGHQRENQKIISPQKYDPFSPQSVNKVVFLSRNQWGLPSRQSTMAAPCALPIEDWWVDDIIGWKQLVLADVRKLWILMIFWGAYIVKYVAPCDVMDVI